MSTSVASAEKYNPIHSLVFYMAFNAMDGAGCGLPDTEHYAMQELEKFVREALPDDIFIDIDQFRFAITSHPGVPESNYVPVYEISAVYLDGLPKEQYDQDKHGERHANAVYPGPIAEGGKPYKFWSLNGGPNLADVHDPMLYLERGTFP